MNLGILIVEDDREMCRFLSELLAEEGYEVAVVYDGPSAVEKYRQESFDLTITDLMMPRMKGTELVQRLKEIEPDALVLLITAFGSIESAVETMRAGAFDYLTKPFRTDEILLSVSRALEQRGLRMELQRLRKEIQSRYGFENIVGKSDSMRRVFEMIAHIGDVPANVLIIGESGTGKELVARAIHYNSPRNRNPFIPLNCAAIPETLLESELFGYLRGAFTDAKRDRKGLFHEASGGSLFLDEISEIPVNLQAKLLRVIEDKEVRPLGASRGEKVDARILAASNRDLDQLVGEGRFRQDLFYRLNVIRIELPPLRERSEDIPLLVEHFIQKFSGKTKRRVQGLTEEALAAILNYHWPGNVRELEHTIERAVLLGKEEMISGNDLPPQLLNKRAKEGLLEEALSNRYTLKELERIYISKVLETTKGNKTEAANTLGVDRTTLYRKLEEAKTKE
ncbi:MAG: sigma-54-dependent Fis family transcriptional regulator [Deltaproteobacteria bacterium]|nr:sigma-54-dependent Fis family transcriptional regulator [Deltaproteobacteria bacterium]